MSAEIKALSDPFPTGITVEEVNGFVRSVDTNMVSDGYHTFGELYEHRITLFMAVCKLTKRDVWMTKVHSDGSKWEGWFLLGINTNSGEQITYHLPISKWNECTEFAEMIEKAPQFDGHTSADVLNRLYLYIN